MITHVIKRDTTKEMVECQKIINRVKKVATKIGTDVPITNICFNVTEQLYDEIPTNKIDEFLAEQLISVSSTHPDYGKLASHVSVSNLHKETSHSFYEVMTNLHNYKNSDNKRKPLISDVLWKNISTNYTLIENTIDYDRDYLIDYFGLKTLERAYLLKINNKIVERPQHMWMRVALTIHNDDIEKAFETYHHMSQLNFTHATPTLFNAGTPRPQLSSCFLMSIKDDSINGIYSSLKDAAEISKWAGGIGIHCSNIRAKNSPIYGTNGTSNGIVPMLRNYNETARYVDQGGGKRNGSFAIYLEMWHSDIFDFLNLKKNHGDENNRARDLFYGLWIDDEFMRRVDKNDKWYLCCPNKCKGLSDVYGDDFVKLYNNYVEQGLYDKEIEARDLWLAVLDAQMETGTPYMLYKDSANYKSNQNNLGIIKSSNLCTEIIEYSSRDETAVCNLASIALSKCVKNKEFDYKKLYELTQIVTRNLNNIIDINYYPVLEAKRSNLLHRPIGIGVQGLADTFALMDVAFDSLEAKQININIFETIYYAACEMSCILATERKTALIKIREAIDNDRLSFKSYTNSIEPVSISKNDPLYNLVKTHNPIQNEINNLEEKHLGSYSTFTNSLMYKGLFQFDMWGIKPSNRYNWDDLKIKIKDNGMRNSLLVAPMPTASTSQILGNNECIEPFTNNIYTRRTLAGDFVCINKYLVKELLDLGLWNEELKNNIIENKGSIQHIKNLSTKIKDKYKTAWELSMKSIINMAADRGAYICQSQSMNIWLEDPTYAMLTSMHFYSWKKGLKTGIYYLRRKPKHNAQQFTIEPKDSECIMCGS